VTRLITRNLNNIIDINFYPVKRTIKSNRQNRPMGIGIQGLADVFAMFKTPFYSDLSRDLNVKIAETIYFAAISESLHMAKIYGPYQTFEGSPLSQGKFHFDLYPDFDYNTLSGKWDWEHLRKEVVEHGVRNSMFVAYMPTATTSQILGNNECFEPYTENIYTRSTIAGEFYVVNKHLMKDLMELNLWNTDMIDAIKHYNGSIADIPSIPDNIKQIYRTVWEIPQIELIKMAVERGPFIDQSQSMSLFFEKPDNTRLLSCIYAGWELGLKTGIYYTRTKPAKNATKFGIDIHKIKELEKKHNSNQNNQDDKLEVRACKFMPKNLRNIKDCTACHS
jgi:ribonucleotide reductase alpha subunit